MSEGAILELVSRGKKDAYLIQDGNHTWFGSSYERRSPSTREIKLLYPENQPRFGQWFDVVIPPDGDVLMSIDLRITMPTWLPPQIASINSQTSAYKVEVESQPYTILSVPYVNLPPTVVPPPLPIVKDPTPLQYGWCDGIANNLIERWCLFVDNVIVLTGFGEFNTWFPDMETVHNLAPVYHAATGRIQQNAGVTTNAQIQANATLGELVFRVPIPGCQSKGDTGLPLCAFPGQKLFIRFWLRNRHQLVNSTQLPQLPLGPDGTGGAGAIPLPMYELCPEPWGRRQIYVNGSTTLTGGVPCGTTLAAREMGHPYIYARCAILNLDNELRDSMKKQKFEIRFHQQLRYDWTINLNDFPSVYKKLIQIYGLFQMLLVGFRSDARTRQCRWLDILPSIGDWITSLSININGQDRILPWDPKKFKTLANNTQLSRDVNIALYYLVFGIHPDNEPGGACNLSRCQKAVLNLIFNSIPVDPISGNNITYGFVVGKAWNILDIENGVAILRFSNY